ncbi:MAG: PorV/PorQ family protein [Flavobacteriia bacterium]|nr:PorV/PorQ family protein [Flavobacteriia bacterium]
MRKAVYSTMLAVAVASTAAFAGNPQRAGSAGANELLINPWAGSSGFANSNIASATGLEATYMNIAGLAFTEGTEVGFANTQWLIGSDISVNSGGLAQRVSETGVLSISVQSFDYGEWEVTTEDLPDGGAGTISPTALTFALGYAQMFTSEIHGGVNIKVFNSNISNLNATGVAIDAGVQYVTGDKDQYKFGVTLKNVGPSFGYSGDGLDIVLPVPQGGYTQSFQSRSAEFELPTQLAIGVAYDIHLVEDVHRLTVNGAFISNSFEKDNFVLGLEYGWRNWFAVRAGYRVDDNRVDGRRSSAITGPAFGFTVNAPLGSSSSFKLDYAYRMTTNFGGIHTIGGTFALN